MKCKVCGKESGKYLLCIECNAKKEKGAIIKCSKCGNWHYTDAACPTISSSVTNQTAFMYEKKRTLLSQKEIMFYDSLKKALPQNYSIFPQINLATFIDRTDNARFRNELFRNVDFLITDDKYQPKLAVEINDQTHFEKDRRERDEKVNNILEEAGIPLLKLWTSYGINQEYINNKVSEMLNSVFERKHHFQMASNSDIQADEPKKSAIQKKKGCYIATCVYGSYDCPPVWTLRRFRDKFLEKYFLGRCFIKIYYKISPHLVKWFGKRKLFRFIWKTILDMFVNKLNNSGYTELPYYDTY